ncbi:MAG: right-handed parallel beta-helix repeat-containing protein [Myxococcota bacterium]
MRVTLLVLVCSFGCGAGGRGSSGSSEARGSKPSDVPPLPYEEDTAAVVDTASPEAQTTVVTACAGGGGDFATLGEAIDAAPDGAVIEACPGVYPERLSVAGRDLTLRGTGGAGDTMVDALGEGVALDVTAGASLAVEGVTFVSGRGDDVGGAVRCADASLALSDVEVRGGSARAGGGLGVARCDVAATRLVAAQNTGEEHGGGVYFEDATGSLSDGDVRANRASYGGGVAVVGGDMRVTSSRVSANHAFVEGGGVWLSADTVTVADSEIVGNGATWSGGGVYVFEGAGELAGNRVADNESLEDGGGICAWTSAVRIAGNVIEGNRAQDDAGGLRIFHGDSVIEANVFRANESGGDGGGAKVSHAYNEWIDNRFESNVTGGRGGGLEIDDDTSHVIGGAFVGNVADGNGGGLHSQLAWYDLVVEDVVFEGNVANGCGGGAAVEDDDPWGVTFARVTFEGNVAGEGGGVCVRSSRVALANVLIVHNLADDGAAVSTDGAIGTLAWVTAWGNVGASALDLGGDLDVHDSIVAGTVAGVGVRAHGDGAWRYNDVWGNEGGAFDGMGDPAGEDGNFSADPLFVDPDGGDWHLDAASPCRDAGEPGETDADGSPADLGRFGGPNGAG